MKTLLHGAGVVNVFTGEIEQKNVLIEDDKIIGVGEYDELDADVLEDVTGKYICPGLIDGHIHIESTMLTPVELAKMCLPRGTTSIIADPHEIANVCGCAGIEYMLQASEGLPLHTYFALPSCVPATGFDESGATLTARDLKPFYAHQRVVALGEMMNYPGVLSQDADVLQKISDAKEAGRVVDGHAPFLGGKDLDRYVAAGIMSDHECTNLEEAKEKLGRGQRIMIRQGTAARNLADLADLIDPQFVHRCLLVTDDRHPADIENEGHIDHIIRLAGKAGKSVICAIQMATIGAADYFGLKNVGAIAPGYRADLLVLDHLEEMAVRDVYSAGKKVVDNKKLSPIATPKVEERVRGIVMNSFHVDPLTPEDFHIEPESDTCRVIGIIPGQLVTKEVIEKIDWAKGGVDTTRDIVKLAVIERHHNTGHKGLGLIQGIGIKHGAIASSVSHDSHNLIVIGTNDEDMALAANTVRQTGGNVVVRDGKILSHMPLPVAGLMTEESGSAIARANEEVRRAAETLGKAENVEPFMNMAFVSLPVIPSLKMSTQGLVDVDQYKRVDLFVK